VGTRSQHFFILSENFKPISGQQVHGSILNECEQIQLSDLPDVNCLRELSYVRGYDYKRTLEHQRVLLKRITVSLSPGCLGGGSLVHPDNSCCLQIMNADAAVIMMQTKHVQIK
jgi:hypothetical protein